MIVGKAAIPASSFYTPPPKQKKNAGSASTSHLFLPGNTRPRPRTPRYWTDLLVLFPRVGFGLESVFGHFGRVRLGGHVGSGRAGRGGVRDLGQGACVSIQGGRGLLVSEVIFELRERQGREGLPSSFLDCSEDMVRELMLVIVMEGLDLRTSAGAKMVLAESLMKGS